MRIDGSSYLMTSQETDARVIQQGTHGETGKDLRGTMKSVQYQLSVLNVALCPQSWGSAPSPSQRQ
jgi:hypothetical protein